MTNEVPSRRDTDHSVVRTPGALDRARGLTLLTLVIAVQWLATRALMDVLLPLVPSDLKEFSWAYRYVGHFAQAAVALSLISVLRPFFPSNFGLAWPKGKSLVVLALVVGGIFGPIMLVVDYLPDLLADSDDRAQPFRYDGAQRSEMIAISGGHPVDKDWVSVSKLAVNR